MVAQFRVGAGVVDIALDIAHALAKPAPCRVIDRVDVKLSALADEIFHRSSEVSSPLLNAAGVVVETDELEMTGKLSGLGQIVEGRNYQTFGKIARRAENHHGAGRRRGRACSLLRGFWLGAS